MSGEAEKNPAASVKRWHSLSTAIHDVHPEGRFVEYADYAKAIDERDAALAELEESRRERDAAQRECERLNDMLRRVDQSQGGIDAYVNQCEELEVTRIDLARANEAIRNMGEAADAERKRLIVEQTSNLIIRDTEIAKLREQVAHQTKCIDAQSATCARYAKQLEQAVGLLRRWRNCESQIGPLDMTFGPNARMLEETTIFLATYDAEAKQKEGD